MLVLLDTHVWIWFREGNPTIQKDAAWIERMADAGNVLISPISCWEVAQLCSKGRIALHLPCQKQESCQRQAVNPQRVAE